MGLAGRRWTAPSPHREDSQRGSGRVDTNTGELSDVRPVDDEFDGIDNPQWRILRPEAARPDAPSDEPEAPVAEEPASAPPFTPYEPMPRAAVPRADCDGARRLGRGMERACSDVFSDEPGLRAAEDVEDGQDTAHRADRRRRRARDPRRGVVLPQPRERQFRERSWLRSHLDLIDRLMRSPLPTPKESRARH